MLNTVDNCENIGHMFHLLNFLHICDHRCNYIRNICKEHITFVQYWYHLSNSMLDVTFSQYSSHM